MHITSNYNINNTTKIVDEELSVGSNTGLTVMKICIARGLRKIVYTCINHIAMWSKSKSLVLKCTIKYINNCFNTPECAKKSSKLYFPCSVLKTQRSDNV